VGAEPDLAAAGHRLFEKFMAPLVLGGAMEPGRPLGGKTALALANAEMTGAGVPLDAERASLVQLARVRVARRLAPVDRVGSLAPADWILGAALHDLVQATHPDLPGTFRKSAPGRLLEIILKTLECAPPCPTLRDALARHTWFARMFEITRVDAVVSWWVGSRRFLGTDPPSRLLTWPELRRVHVERTPRALMDLPAAGGSLDPDLFAMVTRALLAKTPLTDFASCHRAAPVFLWSADTLALVATPVGRTLALRAMSRQPSDAVDAALGRATRAVLQHQAWGAAAVALDLLAQRALAEARVAKPGEVVSATRAVGDASFGRAAGAYMAERWLVQHGEAIPTDEREELLAVIAPLAKSAGARELEALVAPALGPAPPG
jgi:hypothetical protein